MQQHISALLWIDIKQVCSDYFPCSKMGSEAVVWSAAEQRPGVVVVNARNFKTGETERKLDNAGEEANEKLQEYVETIKVGKAH